MPPRRSSSVRCRADARRDRGSAGAAARRQLPPRGAYDPARDRVARARCAERPRRHRGAPGRAAGLRSAATPAAQRRSRRQDRGRGSSCTSLGLVDADGALAPGALDKSASVRALSVRRNADPTGRIPALGPCGNVQRLSRFVPRAAPRSPGSAPALGPRRASGGGWSPVPRGGGGAEVPRHRVSLLDDLLDDCRSLGYFLRCSTATLAGNIVGVP